MKGSRLILILLLAYYSDFWLLQLCSWPYHVYDFIPCLILDTSCTYSELATLLNCKSYTFSHKLDLDVHPSDQACQGIALLTFQLGYPPDLLSYMTNLFWASLRMLTFFYPGTSLWANPRTITGTQKYYTIIW